MTRSERLSLPQRPLHSTPDPSMGSPVKPARWVIVFELDESLPSANPSSGRPLATDCPPDNLLTLRRPAHGPRLSLRDNGALALRHVASINSSRLRGGGVRPLQASDETTLALRHPLAALLATLAIGPLRGPLGSTPKRGGAFGCAPSLSDCRHHRQISAANEEPRPIDFAPRQRFFRRQINGLQPNPV